MEEPARLPVELIDTATDGTWSEPTATCTGLIPEDLEDIFLAWNIEELDFGVRKSVLINLTYFYKIFIFLTICNYIWQ